jgi:murein L,D-transpeptidase YafK
LCDAALKGGQKCFRVHVFPFRMTDERLAKEAGSPWIGFWNELREGYGFFERSKVPPVVTVTGGKYHFGRGE